MDLDPTPFYRAILTDTKTAIELIDYHPVDHRFPMVFNAVINTIQFVWPTEPTNQARTQTLDCCCADWGDDLRYAFDGYLSMPYRSPAENTATLNSIDTADLADAGLRMPWSIMSRVPKEGGALDAFADLLASFDPREQ